MGYHNVVREHTCLNGEPSTEYSWWIYDAQRIPLCRVCDKCEDEKKARYRPEILVGYDQSDVDEDIEPGLPCGTIKPWISAAGVGVSATSGTSFTGNSTVRRVQRGSGRTRLDVPASMFILTV